MLGLLMPVLLCEVPADAPWLSSSERAQLGLIVADDQQRVSPTHQLPLTQSLLATARVQTT